MSQSLQIRKQYFRWELCDHISVVQGCPLVTDPETGKKVDPVGITLVYGWYGFWCLVAASVRGAAMAEDGTYPDEEHTTCDFYDPVAGEEGAGGAPRWVVDLADSRMALLPAPPEITGWSTR